MSKKRTRWTPAEARSVLAELDGSGLSAAEFSRLRHLDPDRLRRWRRRLEGAQPVVVAEGLVELVARDAPKPCGLVVHCPSGHRIEVSHVDLADGLRVSLMVLSELSGAKASPC